MLKPLAFVLFVAAAAVAMPAAAVEKTLYKCRSADGSIAFQEAPCEGQALATIPITEEVPVVKLTDDGCRNMARDLWRLLGRVDLTEFGDTAKKELAERQQSFRGQCNAELERSQRAIECAVLSGAVALSSDAGTPEEQAKTAKVKAQYEHECSAATIDADIDRHLRPAG